MQSYTFNSIENSLPFKVAILDMNEGHANQGMRCIREIVQQFSVANNISIEVTEFDVRVEKEIPDLSFDAYISSGGPGSPLDSIDTDWDIEFTNWIDEVERYNRQDDNADKKSIFFICHSYQIACRHYSVANVCKRRSTSFGVFPIHALEDAITEEPTFAGLKNPFYGVDSRDFQVIQPNHQRLREMGASILCIEKERPHVVLERAIMAIRFNEYFVGTQFHPEADAVGMSLHLQNDDRKKTVIDNHGFEKWQSMIEQLNDPEKILYTHDHILPNFLKEAYKKKIEVLA